MTVDATSGLPIKVLHDRVLVKAEGPGGERRSSGGIVIPATASVLNENASFEQNSNIPQRRIGGTFGKFGIF